MAEARSWAACRGFTPVLILTMASVIVNSPEETALATRLGDVRALIDEAVAALPPDGPHRPQMDIQRAILLERVAAGGRDPAMIEEATREISRVVPRSPDQRAWQPRDPGRPTRRRARHPVPQRQDLRDVRAGLELTERAIAGVSGSPIQRAVLLANHGIQLVRMAWNAGDPGAVGRAVAALRTAIASTPAGGPLDYQLYAILAAALMTRAGQRAGPSGT